LQTQKEESCGKKSKKWEELMILELPLLPLMFFQPPLIIPRPWRLRVFTTSLLFLPLLLLSLLLFSQLCSSLEKGGIVVSPDWVESCYAQKRLIPEERFYSLSMF